MEKITVMVPIDVEISVHISGKIRVHSATWPNFNVIEDQLEVLAQDNAGPYDHVIDGWIVRQKV